MKKLPMTWLSGTINWYDPSTGRGTIIGDDGVWYRIHEFIKLHEILATKFKDKVRVEFKLVRDSIRPVIFAVRDCKESSNTRDKKSKPRSDKLSKDAEV